MDLDNIIPAEEQTTTTAMFEKIDRAGVGEFRRNDWYHAIRTHVDVADFLKMPHDVKQDGDKDDHGQTDRDKCELAFQALNGGDDVSLEQFQEKYLGFSFSIW